MKRIRRKVALAWFTAWDIGAIVWRVLRIRKAKIGIATFIGVTLYLLLGGLITFLSILVVCAGFLYNAVDYLLYYPDLPSQSRIKVDSPAAFGLPYEEVKIFAEDKTELHLYVIKQREYTRQVPTILYFHGNAGNIGHRLQHAAELYRAINCNLVMLEYRGFGKSSGKPSEKGLYLDAKAGVEFIIGQSCFNPNEIVVFGRSLGGAVAIDLATSPLYREKIWCLIVENTFTSIPEMANVQIGWRILKKLPLFMHKNKYTSISKVNKLRVPSLFISGLSDTLVPAWMMEKLYNLCTSSLKQLKRFETGTHNETWNCPGYYEAIQDFLSSVRLHKEKPVEYAQSHSIGSILIV